MLLKLSMSGLKSKFKDYLVLLFGLVMSISIFYMFETLALNKEFVEANATIKSIMSIFQIGSVLLAIITVFYIIYANSFLLSLRQKEFGMYMMLGAKKKKVTVMMFIETLVIGVVSLVVGILMGGIFSKLVSYLLMSQLNFKAGSYYPFYKPSIIITLIFFTILFFVAAIFNSIKLFNTSVLELLHSDAQADNVTIKTKSSVIKAIISIILLILGYLSIINIKITMIPGLFIGMITITAGTYLLFMAFMPTLIDRLLKNKHIKEKGLNVFTLSQLSFRVKELTRVLATVAMLIALSAGAISGGMAFKNNVTLSADESDYYDAVVQNPTIKELDILNKLEQKEKIEYNYKKDKKNIYFNSSELLKNKPTIIKRDEYGNVLETGVIESELKVKDNKKLSRDWDSFLYSIKNYNIDKDLEIKVVDNNKFNSIKEPTKNVILVKTDGFIKNLDQLKKINDIEKDRYKTDEINSKYSFYEMYYSFSSGMVFMGLFLGIAFLAMMASCLMFKILTGASKDIKRYEMLRKIGVRKNLLVKSIYKELLFIYIIPAIVGISHVLIGMQMFKVLIKNPYYHIWISLSIFMIIYLVYYFITVYLYKGIVLPKKK